MYVIIRIIQDNKTDTDYTMPSCYLASKNREGRGMVLRLASFEYSWFPDQIWVRDERSFVITY